MGEPTDLRPRRHGSGPVGSGAARRRALAAAGLACPSAPPRREPGPFDGIARLAAAVTGMPVGGVGFLVDAGYRVVAAVGLPAELTQTPAILSPCAEVVGRGERSVIEDLAAETRFRDSPVVAGGGRAYASVPVVDREGTILGTVFVGDLEPGRATDQQLAALDDLAAQVAEIVHARRTAAALGRSPAAIRRPREAEEDLAARLVRVAQQEQAVADRIRGLERSTSAIVGAVSHQVRTPLTTLIGVAETLSARWRQLAPDDCEQLLQRLLDNAADFQRQLGDLLDLDRLLHDPHGPKVRPVELTTAVCAALEAVELAPRRLDVTLPAAAEVSADPCALRGAIDRMLAHVREHTSEAARVWVRVHRRAQGVELVVADDGPGGAPDPRVPLATLDPHDPDPRLSLGLPWAAATARRHGGRLTVEERQGGGTVMRLWWPAVASDSDAG